MIGLVVPVAACLVDGCAVRAAHSGSSRLRVHLRFMVMRCGRPEARPYPVHSGLLSIRCRWVWTFDAPAVRGVIGLVVPVGAWLVDGGALLTVRGPPTRFQSGLA